MSDIFKFWSQIKRGENIHPADRHALDRILPERHGFRTKDCLPASYSGRLRKAPIVLLYLSPGFDKQDLIDARSEEGRDYYLRRWAGNEPLPIDRSGYKWFKSKTKCFVDYAIAQQKIAFLNIGAYHSVNVKSYSSLLAIPSSRVSIGWAQNVLFPQAEAGERIVICMRSAPYWGLETGRSYGKSLFAPHVTRSGHFIKSKENQKIIELVRSTISN